MKVHETEIQGCLKVDLPIFEDDRGSFLKTFSFSSFKSFGLTTKCTEEYLTRSRRNVVRGMHFQTPPHEHEKVVYCLDGAITDVVLDIRKKSQSYGKYVVFEISSEKPCAVVIPAGCAHGFLTISTQATVLYRVSSEHSKENDIGISWDSFGYTWNVNQPILSGRDKQHRAFKDFESPF